MQIWNRISFKILKTNFVLSSISCIKLLVDFYTLFIKMNYLGHNAESTLVSIVLHARNDQFGIQKYMLGQSEHSYYCSLDYNIIGRRKDVQIHNCNYYVFISAKLCDEWLLSHHQIIPTVTILGADRNCPPVSVISASDKIEIWKQIKIQVGLAMMYTHVIFSGLHMYIDSKNKLKSVGQN